MLIVKNPIGCFQNVSMCSWNWSPSSTGSTMKQVLTVYWNVKEEWKDITMLRRGSRHNAYSGDYNSVVTARPPSPAWWDSVRFKLCCCNSVQQCGTNPTKQPTSWKKASRIKSRQTFVNSYGHYFTKLITLFLNFFIREIMTTIRPFTSLYFPCNSHRRSFRRRSLSRTSTQPCRLSAVNIAVH